MNTLIARLCDSKYHLKCYTETVLKSGLLLDEDMTTVSEHFACHFDENPPPKCQHMYVIVGGVALASAGVALWLKTAKPLLVTAALGLYKGVKLSHIMREKTNFEKTVLYLGSLLKLHRMILFFLEERQICCRNEGKDYMIAYSKKVKTLVTQAFNNALDLLTYLQELVKYCRIHVRLVPQEFDYVEALDLPVILDITTIVKLDDAIVQFKVLCDIYVLLVSNSLACLALTCTAKLSTDDDNVNKIIRKYVPQIRNKSQHCVATITRIFQETRFSPKRVKPARFGLNSAPTFETVRWHNTLYKATTQSSLIAEKSVAIFEKLQQIQLQNLKEQDNLAQYVAALRDQVRDYYESLDILCKLVDISKGKKTKLKESANPVEQVQHKEPLQFVEDLRPIDITELTKMDDDNYEACVTEHEEPSVAATFSDVTEEETARYFSLLNQEMKRALRENNRFQAARDRRGIERRDQGSPDENPDSFTTDSDVSYMPVRDLPKPPPLPKFDWGTEAAGASPPPSPSPLLDSSGAEPNARTNLANALQAAASQRHFLEELYGSHGFT